jgi:hypothetical protein
VCGGRGDGQVEARARRTYAVRRSERNAREIERAREQRLREMGVFFLTRAPHLYWIRSKGKMEWSREIGLEGIRALVGREY